MGTLDPWINSSTGDGYRNSVVALPGDGVKTAFDFNFGGGYIDKSNIKAYTYDTRTGHTETVAFSWLGPNTIQVLPAPASYIHVVIYRDTPKSQPLVDFSTNASMTEKNLDLMAKQAIFAAAEVVDRFDSINAGSSDAIERSVVALATANDAKSQATAAVNTANAANGAAASANAKADNAVAVANDASTTAHGIDAKAQTALDNSAAAVATANQAKTTANGIDAKAQTALDNSNTANTNASAAVATANAAAATVGGKLDKNGSVAMVANFDLGNNRAVNVATPQNNLDAANKAYVDSRHIPESLVMNPYGEINQIFGQAIPPAVNPKTFAYFADQWATNTGGSGFTYAARPVVGDGSSWPAVSKYSQYQLFSMTNTVKAALDAVDFCFIQQPIEGKITAPLRFGTNLARQAWLRFRMVGTQPGVVSLAIRNGGGTRSFVVPCAVTTTVQDYLVSVPGDTTGTWATDTAIGVHVTFCHASGTNMQTAATGVWVPGNYVAHTTQTNFLATSAAGFHVSDIGFYVSDTPPPFIPPSYDRELVRVRRYYCKSYNVGVQPGTVDHSGEIQMLNPSANQFPVRGHWRFQVSMRVPPTCTGYNSDSGALSTWGEDTATQRTFSTINTSTEGCSYQVAGVAAGSGVRGHIVASAQF